MLKDTFVWGNNFEPINFIRRAVFAKVTIWYKSKKKSKNKKIEIKITVNKGKG